MSSFYLLLTKCKKYACSAFFTFNGILYILLEDLLMLVENLYINATSFTFDLSKQDLSIYDEDSNDNDFLGPQRGGTKFMNKYSVNDIKNIIKRSTIDDSLNKIGFSDWHVEFDLTDSFNHYLYLRSKRYQDKEKYIGFIIVRIDQRHKLKISSHSPKSIQFIEKNIDFSSLNLLNIRWLSLQNPSATFSSQRPRLPGQKFPGSGIGRSVLTVIRRLCIMNGRDGIMNVPEHFHNAFLYEGFVFIDPEVQGSFEKMKIDLHDDIDKFGLATVSGAIGMGALKLGGETYKWNPGEQIFPLSKKTLFYFNSCDYTEIVDSVIISLPKFEIDWNSTGLIQNNL
ncbi:hypothetical protein M9Y10_037556 [Tritrichomonas musculus]|uniref:TLDc domain-containing protein n=1 Tax=Tritrichomonas musculus TaxID=1915356 RepID=A0ABR2GST1_9EUKA